MTNTERLIEIATHNGWVHKMPTMKVENSLSYQCFLESAFLDPLFFQALGRGLGWWEGIEGQGSPETYFKKQQHLLIDYLQSGKSIEDFAGDIVNK